MKCLPVRERSSSSDVLVTHEHRVMSLTTWVTPTSSPSQWFELGRGCRCILCVRTWRRGRLSVLGSEDGFMLSMSAVWQTKSSPRTAGRWFTERLRQIPVTIAKVLKARIAKPKVRRPIRS